MAEVKKMRGKGTKSFLALHKLEELGLCPIDEALKDADDLEKMYQKNVEAYDSGRGYGEKNDAGTTYLANAIRAKSEKMALWLKLAGFIYPTLSAVGIKDIRKEEETITQRVVSAAEVRQTILDDPFAMSGPLPELTGGFTPESEKLNELREVQHSGEPDVRSNGAEKS